MMHIDMTMEIVTLEALEVNEVDGVLAIFATAGVATMPPIVERKDETVHDTWDALGYAAGATAPGLVVLREFHLNDPGEYHVWSSTRDRKRRREFFFKVEDMGKHSAKFTVLPGSSSATWILGDYDPVKIEGNLPVTIHIDNGRVASIEVNGGQTQRRPTSWEQLDSDAF